MARRLKFYKRIIITGVMSGIWTGRGWEKRRMENLQEPTITIAVLFILTKGVVL
jgi:hypothetical protein